MKLYDSGDFEGAVALLEEALVEYYKADVECRALCQWPQKFKDYDYLRYRYSLYEVISGETREVIYKCIFMGAAIPNLFWATELFNLRQ